MMATRVLLTVLALAACFAAAGCVSPGDIDAGLITRYQQAILARSPQGRAGDAELDLLRPLAVEEVVPLRITVDRRTNLKTVDLALDQAMRLALMNNLDIRLVSFDPAFSREEMIKAAAAFDFVVFGSLTHNRADERSETGFAPFQSRTFVGEAGVRKMTTLGTRLELTYDLSRDRDNSAFTWPDPRYESVLSLALTQPLLRGAGADYNLASLEVARLGREVSLAKFREQVETTIAEVQQAYWGLVQARREQEIHQRLLTETIRTLGRVRERRKLDATEVELKQVEAAVESRQATLLLVRKSVRDMQYRLARLLADARLPLTEHYRINPVTPLVASKVRVDPADQLVAGLKHNPVLEQTRLAIETADVAVRVAENEALPKLDLTASMSIQALRGKPGPAIGDMFGLDYISHSVGLLFERPIGNRAAKAALRQRKLQRLRAITALQNVADQLAVGVNEAIRHIEVSFDEIQAQRRAVKAYREHLKTLEPRLEIQRGWTPESLLVLLQGQESLAAAERAELQATINYNNALVTLSQVTGTALQQHNVKLATETAIEGKALLPAPPREGPGAEPK